MTTLDTDRTFDPKDPSEIVPLTFDFAEDTSTPSNPVITIVRHSGAADANPAIMLTGSAQVSGATVLQKISGGVAGANYTVRCQVDAPDGTRWVLSGLLPVKTA
jgi:hypothetical protein